MNVILIDSSKTEVLIAILENGKLIEIICDCADNIVGNTYIGCVQSTEKTFAFVDIGFCKNGFLQDIKNIKNGDFVKVKVKKNSTNKKGPVLDFIEKSEIKEKCLVTRVDYIQRISSIFNGNIDKIIINNKTDIDKIKLAFNFINKEIIEFLDGDIFSEYEIKHKIPTSNKAWLKSGGYIILEKTEACTVIDVNTGKSNKLQHTVNIEAAKEIAYQIRLRNISGIIIIDFINSKNKEETKELLDILKEYTKKDRLPVQVFGITKLGMVEMTRQRI